MKKYTKGVLFLLTILLCLLAGCGKEQAEQTPTLWVVTEKSKWDGMTTQVRQMIRQFEEEHPEFEVKLDVVPVHPYRRQLYIESLRVPIMSGKGPDVYLLPTDTTDTERTVEVRQGKFVDYWEEDIRSQMLPLFKDVQQNMSVGLFADLSEYYDADEALGKEKLNTAIMDAGLYFNGSKTGRYILPLRYSFPVLYTDDLELKARGYSLEDIGDNILDVMDFALKTGEEDIIWGAEPYQLLFGRGYSLLPQPIDYQNKTINVTQEEVAALLRSFQALEAQVGTQRDQRMGLLLYHYIMPWSEYTIVRVSENEWVPVCISYRDIFPDGNPLAIGWLEDAINVEAFSRSEGRPFSMTPLKGVGGQQAAFVTYYGAISASCQHPQEAYEFLRQFLLEESQWELNRKYLCDDSFWHRHVYPTKREALIEDGWPVRIKGQGKTSAVNTLWDSLKGMGKHTQYNNRGDVRRAREIWKNTYTDEDIHLFETEFDFVYFGNTLEQELTRMIRSLNDPLTGEPTDVDIDAMAADFIKQLNWQLLEG